MDRCNNEMHSLDLTYQQHGLPRHPADGQNRLIGRRVVVGAIEVVARAEVSDLDGEVVTD